MSETKLREFNRSSCEKILMEAIKRARDINQNKGRKKYLCYVDRLTVFGSLINSSKEKIHDVDLYVSVWFIGKFDSQACYDYSEKYGPESLMYRGWYRIVEFPRNDVYRTIKARSVVLSVHIEPLERMLQENGLYFDVIRDHQFQKAEYNALKRHLAGIRATGDSYLKRHSKREVYGLDIR